MTALSIAAITALAAACGPLASPSTLTALVRVESGFDPLAIGVNGRRPARVHPTSLKDAVGTAQRLIAAGSNIDLGLGQINVRNLEPLGLTVEGAFDPCRNLAAAAHVLKADFGRASLTIGSEQNALRTSLSLYNTGDAYRGFQNGYVAKVVAAADPIVPTLQPKSTSRSRPAEPPPAWDVFARPTSRAFDFVLTPSAAESTDLGDSNDN